MSALIEKTEIKRRILNTINDSIDINAIAGVNELVGKGQVFIVETNAAMGDIFAQEGGVQGAMNLVSIA
jgi:hypothetical protein